MDLGIWNENQSRQEIQKQKHSPNLDKNCRFGHLNKFGMDLVVLNILIFALLGEKKRIMAGTRWMAAKIHFSVQMPKYPNDCSGETGSKLVLNVQTYHFFV